MAQKTVQGKSQQKRPSFGRPPQAEVAARNEHLLDVATAVFLECGYEKANLNDIAERAGTSKRTIYYHYPNKAELFIAVIKRKSLELQERFASKLNSKEPMRTILEDFGATLLNMMANPDFRSLSETLFAVVSEFPEPSRTFWETGAKRFMMLLSDCLSTHPEFKGKDPTSAAEAFCSLCWGLSVLQRQLIKGYKVPEAVRRRKVAEAVRIFLLAYC